MLVSGFGKRKLPHCITDSQVKRANYQHDSSDKRKIFFFSGTRKIWHLWQTNAMRSWPQSGQVSVALLQTTDLILSIIKVRDGISLQREASHWVHQNCQPQCEGPRVQAAGPGPGPEVCGCDLACPLLRPGHPSDHLLPTQESQHTWCMMLD